MAKKTTRKYRQARAAAKPAAKAAFPGKVKAGRRDPMAKYSAEDREIFKELEKESKRGYITDDRGNKVYVKPEETAKERIAREREAAMRKYREQIEAEDGPKKPAKKAAPKTSSMTSVTDKRTPAEKAQSKKAAAKEVKKNTKKFIQKGSPKVVDTPVTKGGELEKKLKAEKAMTRAEKSAANKAAWAKMTPEERKNWKSSKPNVATKPATPVKPAAAAVKPAPAAPTPKRVTLADLKKNEAKGLAEAKKRVEAKKAAATKPRIKITVDGKTSTPAKPTAGQQAINKMEAAAKAKAAAKKSTPKFRRTKALGKAGAVGALAGEVVSMAKGSTNKDIKEIVRLENKLRTTTGKEKEGTVKTFLKGMGLEAGQLANLATMGVVGKTRRQRMDELNALIAKAEAKKAKANKGLRYGKMGESLVPGTAAYKAGSKTRPTAATVTSGGSTTKVDTNKYTVKKGDTFSGIAKTAGVSLSELRAANPDIMKKKKYKQGSMIWSGTKVNIPKK